MKVTLIVGALAVVTGAFADGIVPNAFAATEAPGTFSLTATAAAGRTYQMTIAASQLTGMVNHNISGMTFRLGNTATAAWPNVATSFSAWDIYMGAGVAPALMSNTSSAGWGAAAHARPFAATSP